MSKRKLSNDDKGDENPPKKSALNPLTKVKFILDKSGSMYVLGNEPVRSLNSFLTEQKIVGEFLFTLALFSNTVEMVYDNVSSNDITTFTEDQYRVGGGTALYDAIGQVLSSEKDDHKSDNDVICVILTDGLENCSRKFSQSQISNMIKTKEECGWKFMYLGANQDAFAVGGSIGITNSINFEHNPTGYSNAMQSVSISMSAIRNLDLQSATLTPSRTSSSQQPRAHITTCVATRDDPTRTPQVSPQASVSRESIPRESIDNYSQKIMALYSSSSDKI